MAHQCDGNTNFLHLTFLNFWRRLLHQQAPRLQSPVMRRKIGYYNSRRCNNEVTTLYGTKMYSKLKVLLTGRETHKYY